MYCENKPQIASSIFMILFLAGLLTIFCSIMIDYIGRRLSFFLAIICSIVGSLLGCFAASSNLIILGIVFLFIGKNIFISSCLFEENYFKDLGN